MSKFRERTAAIVEQGEAERKSFEPKGTPARVYNYWLTKSMSDKAEAIRYGSRRENFCHWFWVVVFFAPALAIGRFIDRHAWVLALPFVALALFGLFASVGEVGILTTLLFIGAGVLFVAVLLGFIVGISFLIEKFPDVMGKIGVSLFVLAVVALVGLFVAAIVSSHGIVGAVVLATVAIAIGLVIWKFQTIASYIEGREEARLQERLDNPRPAAVVSEPREPGRISKFFKGVGEFIVMVAQFVRVKKWKTCPLIEVNTVKDEF